VHGYLGFSKRLTVYEILANYLREAVAQWVCITMGDLESIDDSHIEELQAAFPRGNISLEAFVQHVKNTDQSDFREFGAADEIRKRLETNRFQSDEASSYFADPNMEEKVWYFSHKTSPRVCTFK
jgi:hypothetical protein